MKALVEVLPWAALVAVPLFSFHLGLDANRLRLRRLFGHPGVLGRLLVTTDLLIPAIAILLALTLPVSPYVRFGLVLLSLAPPGGGAPKLAGRMAGDRELAYAWQALSVGLSFVTIPVLLLIVQSLMTREMDLGIGPVLENLSFTYVVPFGAGLLLHALWGRGAGAISPVVARAATIGNLLLLLLVLVTTAPLIPQLGAVGIAVVVGFAALNFVLGLVTGGHDRSLRATLVAALSMRRLGVPIVIAQASHNLAAIAPVIVVYLLASLALLIPVTTRRSRPEAHGRAG
jgi:predicted Na+-dependent transporter